MKGVCRCTVPDRSVLSKDTLGGADLISWKASETGCRLGFCVVVVVDFLEVALVNKITQISGVQFCNTSPVYGTVCSPPQTKSPSASGAEELHLVITDHAGPP